MENNNMEVVPTGRYAPLSAWAYFGLGILFSVPIVGFVFLIVFSFSKGNINRRSYARSYFCGLLFVAIVLIVLVICCGSIAGVAALFDRLG